MKSKLNATAINALNDCYKAWVKAAKLKYGENEKTDPLEFARFVRGELFDNFDSIRTIGETW